MLRRWMAYPLARFGLGTGSSSGAVSPVGGTDFLLINATDKLLINATDFLLI